jgi:uroporphyrinogen decarboxylase
MQVSFTPEFADRLRADLQLKGQKVHNPHGGGNTYELERALDEDLLLTSVGWVNGYYQPGYQDVDTYTDEWGVTWKSIAYSTRFGKGKYTEPFGHPLADEAAIETYRPPDPHRPELYSEAARVRREFQDEYWIVGVVVTTIFETAWALRGYDRLMMDFLLHPDLAERILDIPYRYHLTAAQKLVLSNTRFALDLYGELKTANGNVLFSPYSISTVGILAYRGARGETARQLAAALRFTLLKNVGRMPETWDGRHVRAFAGLAIARFNNHPAVKRVERQIRKSDVLYSLDY